MGRSPNTSAEEPPDARLLGAKQKRSPRRASDLALIQSGPIPPSVEVLVSDSER
jgi:hypothetical protein